MRRLPAGDDYDGWVQTLTVGGRRQQAKRHLLAAGASALPAVRRGLQHPEAIVRRTCVNLLDHLVDVESMPDLVAALDDADVAVRARALHALACDQCKQNACRPGEDLWVPRAIAIVREGANADLRAAAIDALGKVVRRDDVFEALSAAADCDPNPGLRQVARRASARAARRRDATARSAPG